MSDKLLDRAESIIKGNRYLNLATYDSTSSFPVWSTPLAYYYDSDLVFYFYSETSSRHVSHVNANAISSFSIYNSTLPSDDVDGLQAEGRCSVVPDSDLSRIVPAYYEQSFPDPEIRKNWERPSSDFSGSAAQKFFAIDATGLFLIDLDEADADRRVEVDRAHLCNRFVE